MIIRRFGLLNYSKYQIHELSLFGNNGFTRNIFSLVLGSLFSTKEVKSPYENRIGTGRRGHARHVYLRYIGCLFGERH